MQWHRFVRKGWFFSEVKYYEDNADKLLPKWKTLSVENWYFSDGKWKKRAAACGVVKHE